MHCFTKSYICQGERLPVPLLRWTENSLIIVFPVLLSRINVLSLILRKNFFSPFHRARSSFIRWTSSVSLRSSSSTSIELTSSMRRSFSKTSPTVHAKGARILKDCIMLQDRALKRSSEDSPIWTANSTYCSTMHKTLWSDFLGYASSTVESLPLIFKHFLKTFHIN